jgi:hypothetical protein
MPGDTPCRKGANYRRFTGTFPGPKVHPQTGVTFVDWLADAGERQLRIRLIRTRIVGVRFKDLSD